MGTATAEVISAPRRAETGPVELKVDRGIYLVDDATRTYRYLRRNYDWVWLDREENERNKRHLSGYTRIFTDGRRKVFDYRPPYAIV